jgi:hypothetical protein
MAKWTVRKSVTGTSPWPKKTISVTNKSAKLTPRQKSFSNWQVAMVKKSLNMKNK